MDSGGTLIECVTTFTPKILEIIFGIIAIASSIAAATPTPKDDGWVARVYRIVDLFALNVGYAKETPKSFGGRFVAD